MVSTSRPAPLRPDSRPAAGLPPHDISAEEAVIAALLLDEDAYPHVLPILQPQDFFREQHGWCYEACQALADRAEAITIPTLAHELDRAGHLDAIGGGTAPWEGAGPQPAPCAEETQAAPPPQSPPCARPPPHRE